MIYAGGSCGELGQIMAVVESRLPLRQYASRPGWGLGQEYDKSEGHEDLGVGQIRTVR
jgi:hypothetical protein